MSDTNDKLYIVIILGIIGFFIYWYQTHNKMACNNCNTMKKSSNNKNKRTHRRKEKYNDDKKKKNVRFRNPVNDEDSIVSLASLDSIDRNDTQKKIDTKKEEDTNDSDTKSLESLDI